MFLFVYKKVFGGPEPFTPLRVAAPRCMNIIVQNWGMVRGCYPAFNGYLFWGRVEIYIPCNIVFNFRGTVRGFLVK
jgi:hypothetical protein